MQVSVIPEHFYLYLPRNLSHCGVCEELLEAHVRRKMKLVEKQLLRNLQTCALFLKQPTRTLPGIPINDSESDSDEDDDDVIPVEPRGILVAKPSQKRRFVFPPKKQTSFPSVQVSSQRLSKDRRKAVRFADTLGLELESIQNIFQTDLPPVVPSYALDYLRKDKLCLNHQLIAKFVDPGTHRDFHKEVERLGICLEKTTVVETTIHGVARVKNIAFHKRVSVRFTTDDWRTFSDVDANFVAGSHCGKTDKFAFSVFVPQGEEFVSGKKLYLALSYIVAGQELWDNNGGKNYCYEFFVRKVPVALNQSWVNFL